MLLFFWKHLKHNMGNQIVFLGEKLSQQLTTTDCSSHITLQFACEIMFLHLFAYFLMFRDFSMFFEIFELLK